MGRPAATQKPPGWVWIAAVLGLVGLSLGWLFTGQQGVHGARSLILICPIADGVVKDNFGRPRSDHTHTGNDVYADWGTPVLATFDGRISNSRSPGGMIVTLEAPDGAFIVGKHLSDTTREGPVRTGDIIGYVGTLKVPGALPHLHFEWHPDGGPPVDPFPHLREVCPDTREAGERPVPRNP